MELEQKLYRVVDDWLEEIYSSKIIQRSSYLNMRPDIQAVDVWCLKRELAILKMRLKGLLITKEEEEEDE